MSDWSSAVCSSDLSAGRDADFTFHQQVRLLQLFDEQAGALTGFLEALAEIQDAVRRFGRLGVFEQKVALIELADRAGCRIETERQPVRLGAQAREQVLIAADLGGTRDGIERGDLVVRTRDEESVVGERSVCTCGYRGVVY